jgi:hypothetical protein
VIGDDSEQQTIGVETPQFKELNALYSNKFKKLAANALLEQQLADSNAK